MVDFSPAAMRDVVELGLNLRLADQEELRAAHGQLDFHAIIGASVDASVAPFTARDESGQLIAIFGHAPVGTILTPMASPWLLGTDRIRRHAGVLVRASRAYVASWREEYPLLVNFVDARNLESIRYLRAVGFTLDEPAPFGIAGSPFHRFHMGLSESV